MEKSTIILYFSIIMSNIREKIESFEKILGCHICVHEYPGERCKLTGCSHRHQNKFCEKVKKHKRSENLCYESDYRLIKNQMFLSRNPFFKICHAGYLEAVSPIFIKETLIGAVFAGPYILNQKMPSKDQNFFIDPLATTKEFLKYPGPPPPEIDSALLPHLLNMTGLLAEALENFLKQDTHNHARQTPMNRILFFFEHDFRKKVQLKDLAKSIGVGDSRASQLLRQQFHSTFPQMLNQRRIEYAKRLLSDTSMNISMIAEECGFTDPAYFYRTFKMKTGNTPSEFRRDK